MGSNQKDKGRIHQHNGPVQNHRETSFRKGDFDPRTTATVKEEYSEGREALEETIPRVNPRKDTTDNLSETQGEQVTRQTACKRRILLRNFHKRSKN